MKFILVWQLCSLITNTCIPPYTDRNYLDSYVECAIAGAEKVIEVANKDKKTPQLKVSTSNKRFRVLISGRRFGKTYLCITEMMKYASKPNKKVWYVAPSFKMAKEIAWSSLKEMLNQFNWIEDINETNMTIKIKK